MLRWATSRAASYDASSSRNFDSTKVASVCCEVYGVAHARAPGGKLANVDRCAASHSELDVIEQIGRRICVRNGTDVAGVRRYPRCMVKTLASLLVAIALAPVSAAEQPLSLYRTLRLGDSVDTVTERLQLATSDVKVLYEHPALVQEATWRPHRFVSGSITADDPLAQMTLTFYAGRLTRIVATYDRNRTQGLTDADLAELLGVNYGAPLLPESHRDVEPSRRAIARWMDDRTQVLLWREEYPRLIGLTVTAIADERDLLSTMAEGARLAALGAPARARALQVEAAAAIEARDARIRLENKAKFKP